MFEAHHSKTVIHWIYLLRLLEAAAAAAVVKEDG